MASEVVGSLLAAEVAEAEVEEEEERALLAVTLAMKLLVASALEVVVKAEFAASFTFRSALSKRFQRTDATGSVTCEKNAMEE